MGGGGGFAGSGGNTIDVGEETVVRFEEWKPELGLHARAVLKHKVANPDDVCLESLKLLWLGRQNEAKLRLAHIPAMGENDTVALQDISLPSVAGDKSMSEDVSSSSVLRRSNAVINFCSGPTLLKGLNPKKRVLWSSALLVSRALGRCGIEIPSMRILQRIADPNYEEKHNTSDISNGGSKSSEAYGAQSSESSIFDSFDTAQPQRRQTKSVQQATASSSIFDTFDPAPSSQPASSIFDSFDTAPQKPKPAPSQPASIFDSFDTAPQKPKPAPMQTTDMSSSIFDSFDTAPQKPKPAPKQAAMSSSIFDSFDAAPQKPKPTPSQPASIFDSFDTAPQKP
eukprot:scaffold39468_cov178-Skeletonema_dohrnii-CCMP3373.AAC.1